MIIDIKASVEENDFDMNMFTFSLTWAFRFAIRYVIGLNIIISLFVFT